MTRVGAKICGLSTPETLDAAIGHGAALVGFVFFPRSPRDVSTEQAAALARRVPEHVGRVGVFVDPDDDLVLRTVEQARLTAIQLHGSETPERAAALARLARIDVWKAVPVRTRADLAGAAAYRGAADRILYDAKPAKGAELPGGMGMRFDWALLDGFSHPLPWALSGGLQPDNVAEAARTTGAQLLDVSSGVESAPGIKDVDKIARFLQAVSRL